MIFEFKPWVLDIDVEETKKLYQENNYSIDSQYNLEFINILSPSQLSFFDNLGVDLTKVEIEKSTYDIPQDGEIPAFKMKKLAVNFLLKGNFITLCQYQKDLYSDEEVFGKEFPSSINVIADNDDYIKTYDNGIGSGIVFKHPYFHYNFEKFKKWDCGYILGSILYLENI